MRLGIVGLPNVGKSTLFNSLTEAGAQSANYPFCTIDPNVGIVAIPDERLEKLKEMYNPKKVIPTTIEFVDIAGLVKGASKGEGLGNKFLSNIREVDAIIHVVRCFEDSNITHVEGSVDPVRDIETIDIELIFSDLEVLERRIEKTRKAAKSRDKKQKFELETLEKIKSNLEKNIKIKNISLSPEEQEILDSLNLLSSKPIIYAANIAEDDMQNLENDNIWVSELKSYAQKENSEVIVVCGKIEEEISQLDASEKSNFLYELGLKESGLDRLIKASYNLLGLISFLTAGPKEVRAWTIEKGTKAPQAAGKIHTDFERGFIKAEVISFDELNEIGSYTAAKEKGLVRLEGKEYIIQDGDVILFRFNV